MKTKILMLVMLLGCTTLVMAQPNGNGKKNHDQSADCKMQKHEEWNKGQELELTDAQKEAFKQSRLAMFKLIQPIQNELQEAEARQKTLTTAEKPDMGAINKNIERIGQLKTDIAKIQAKHRIEMRAQLSDEQRMKFDMHHGKMKHDKGHKGLEHGERMKG